MPTITLTAGAALTVTQAEVDKLTAAIDRAQHNNAVSPPLMPVTLQAGGTVVVGLSQIVRIDP